MLIVSPYRPFPRESAAHQAVGPFDWVQALRWLSASAARYGARVVVLTDTETDVGGLPAFRYSTSEPRLMLWLMDVMAAYLASSDFQDDTVLLSPDMLVCGDLQPWFRADFGLVVRPEPKYAARPVLNSAQWWRVDAQERLAAFYARACAYARTLPASVVRWGADTVPLVDLLSPIRVGHMVRDGLTVDGIPHRDVLHALTAIDIAALEAGRSLKTPGCPIVEFRYRRKQYMAAYVAATCGSAVAA